MAAPLEFKRRVRLPEAIFDDPPERQRSYRWALGAGVWLAVVALAVGITEGVVPVERWFAAGVADDSVAPAPASARAPAASRPTESAGPYQPATAAALPKWQPSFEPSSESSAEPPPSALEPAASPPVREPEPAARTERALVADSSGPSCEQAAAEAVQEIVIGADPGRPDLAREDYASVLDSGTYFSHCGVPDSMRIDICAAVRNGRAVGVTVRTDPGNRELAQCVAHAVRALAFPSHPRLDVVKTSFAPR